MKTLRDSVVDTVLEYSILVMIEKGFTNLKTEIPMYRSNRVNNV